MQACLKMSRKEPVFKISLELKRHYMILSLEHRIPTMFCSPTLCDTFIGLCGCLMEAVSILKMTQPNWNVYCIRHISNAHKLPFKYYKAFYLTNFLCVCAWSLYSLYFPSEVNSGAYLFPHPSVEIKNQPPVLGIGGQPYLGRNAEFLVPKTPSIGLSPLQHNNLPRLSLNSCKHTCLQIQGFFPTPRRISVYVGHLRYTYTSSDISKVPSIRTPLYPNMVVLHRQSTATSEDERRTTCQPPQQSDEW